ncbi:hypothetical protein I6F35_35730 [Bradyrhizobium sp. BRP22]|uniref:hypothetical protein n=1 Tax=Bradyrhizobium sp. BRP22 TaxID=2793821 RepID=UPI001CD67F1F|nr:hypothetical protein [Bradyrhizobium sp. BRP22]MCA1458459.1 hypothetical protein [Bradyrhizobium sp. BRP22]
MCRKIRGFAIFSAPPQTPASDVLFGLANAQGLFWQIRAFMKSPASFFPTESGGTVRVILLLWTGCDERMAEGLPDAL